MDSWLSESAKLCVDEQRLSGRLEGAESAGGCSAPSGLHWLVTTMEGRNWKLAARCCTGCGLSQLLPLCGLLGWRCWRLISAHALRMSPAPTVHGLGAGARPTEGEPPHPVQAPDLGVQQPALGPHLGLAQLDLVPHVVLQLALGPHGGEHVRNLRRSVEFIS